MDKMMFILGQLQIIAPCESSCEEKTFFLKSLTGKGIVCRNR